MGPNDLRDWNLPGPSKLLLDVRDVAKFLEVSTDTIRDWIKQGKFPAGQLNGGEMTWTGADIAAYIQLRGRLSILDEKPSRKQTD